MRRNSRFPWRFSIVRLLSLVLRATWKGLRPTHQGLGASWRALRASQRGMRATKQGLRASQVGMYKWSYRISPHSTGLCPLSGPLPEKEDMNPSVSASPPGAPCRFINGVNH